MPRNASELGVAKDKRLLPYGTRSLDPAIRLVDRAREIEEAGQMLEGQLHGKLALIQRQIHALQEEARRILEESHEQLELHKIPCAFEKRIGQTIYLYKRPDGNLYFSLLSPEDWAGRPPHHFEGAYTLLPDRSFRKENENEK